MVWGVASRIASLLLRFGGERVDVKILLSLRVSRGLWRRVTDCIVAFKVWGWKGGC